MHDETNGKPQPLPPRPSRDEAADADAESHDCEAVDAETHDHDKVEEDGHDYGEATPELVRELCAACAAYVLGALHVPLDFEPETLPLVDHYLSLARAELEARPELAPLVARAAGAYFGEVVRYKFGGTWDIPSDNVHDWRVCLRPVFLHLNPVGAAYDALYGNEQHDGPRSPLRVAPEYRAEVELRLGAVPPISEDEYYLLSTRLEGIEVAAVALKARMSADGYEDVEYEVEDYRAELYG